jgi:hypothetical protein
MFNGYLVYICGHFSGSGKLHLDKSGNPEPELFCNSADAARESLDGGSRLVTGMLS